MPRRQAFRIYTIGHSTRTLQEFIDALKAHGVERLVDIRTAPSSRHVPHFNATVLAEALPRAGIEYTHMKELGGWRKAAPESPNTGWESPGFQGYADHMQTDAFRHALDRLIAMAQEKPTAYMCAEATPYRCHRMLVSDALTARGLQVLHILDARRAEPHRMTKFARAVRGRVTYPPPS